MYVTYKTLWTGDTAEQLGDGGGGDFTAPF